MSLTMFAQQRLKAKAKKARQTAKAKRLKLRRAQAPKALAKRLDTLTGALVRSRGHCESGRETHRGPLQWAHGISRSYKAVRWDTSNGFCLCAGCHQFFTFRPLEWTDWLIAKLGEDGYQHLRDYALHGPKPDKVQLLADLDSKRE